MGNANIKELTGIDLHIKGGKKPNTNAQRAALWQSTGIVSLRDMDLMVIPDPVFGLGKLVRTLDATNNRLEQLPSALGMLVGLQRLVLASNRLQSLPSSIGSLSSLKILTLDTNKLHSLPFELGNLKQLERLTVSDNALSSLPDSLMGLTKLVFLDVRNNKLKSLPPTLGSCTALEELNAAGNMLKILPQSIVELKQLGTLTLTDNQISSLPPQLLTGCERLHTLELRKNPLNQQLLEQMEGYSEYEERRKLKVDKRIAANVMLNESSLDVGVDRR